MARGDAMDVEAPPVLEEMGGTWEIDPAHSSVEFSVRHMMIAKVNGRFDRFAGTFSIGSDPAASTADVVIDAATISTHEQERDDHLRSVDFLDVERFPHLRFRGHGASIVSAADGTFLMNGSLTIRKVTRTVELRCQFEGMMPKGTETEPRIAFSAATSISRNDFGLTWNRPLETGGVLVGDRVDIQINVEARAVQAEGV